MVEEIVDAVKAGATLKGVICEKPLARNLAEARRVVELVEDAKLPHAYFENQMHMKSMQAHRAQLAPIIEAMGPPLLARSAEEHAGPHNAWFWDPDAARRRRDERHGLPLPGRRLVRADAAGQGRRGFSSRKA